MNIAFKKMCPEHISQVVEIEQASFPAPWPQQVFTSEIQNEFAHYIVAAVNEQVIGYGGMWLVLDEAQVTNVAVHPAYRMNNIGKMIMLELMRRAILMGIDKMTLEVRLSNLVARHLYASLGFEKKGMRKKYYLDNNEDAIIMWKHDLGGNEVTACRDI
ncbi:MAG: ribosomal-protein-alanine N-acetyltransferase [Pelotomaculum sp. PtaU1.Bin035]|nr:MAG: ribosomal-protein-alanine N-acetyltransferase [Pelotomaculum sp. PtaU1.Bin035]